MSFQISSQIAKFMGLTWGPPGCCRPQMGPILAPWNLLSGIVFTVCRVLLWLGTRWFSRKIPDCSTGTGTIICHPIATKAIQEIWAYTSRKYAINWQIRTIRGNKTTSHYACDIMHGKLFYQLSTTTTSCTIVPPWCSSGIFPNENLLVT